MIKFTLGMVFGLALGVIAGRDDTRHAVLMGCVHYFTLADMKLAEVSK